MLKTIIKDQFDLLLFRNFKPKTKEFPYQYLLFGLMTAILAGIGRYWDNPRAHWWQYAGMGSFLYCFVLAFLIYIILSPLKPENWSYYNVLTFVSLTSLPALLYAIPVEKFMNLHNAQITNLWFLLTVALWRVILFVLYLKRSARLSGMKILVSFLLPIILIITMLSILNLEHVIIKLMAGLREDEKSVNDLAYMIVLFATFFSYYLLPVIVPAYLYFIYKKKKSKLPTLGK